MDYIATHPYKTVREFVTDPATRKNVLYLASHMLNVSEGIPDLEKEILAIPDRSSAADDTLVMFTSFINKDDTLRPAGAIYRTFEITDLNMGIDDWDVYCSRRHALYIADDVFRFMKKMSPERMAALLQLEDKIPAPVPWTEVHNPLNVLVNSARSAAIIITWMFPEKKGSRSVVPELLEPHADAEPTADPDRLFAAISRYKALVNAIPRFWFNWLLTHRE